MPELQKLRRNSIGSVEPGLPLMPPAPVMYYTREVRKTRNASPPKTRASSSATPILSRSNIIINPETYEIVAIIDWEYARFGPEWFERKLWRSTPRERDRGEEKASIKAGRDFLTGGELK
jgi:hypothetical protein